jgi:hypothetical protein
MKRRPEKGKVQGSWKTGGGVTAAPKLSRSPVIASGR